jgi:glutaconate CoA-transferase, subunit B
MTAPTDYTTDELMAVCIARLINDGECVAQGIATPMVSAGYFLAKLTHAPNLLFASAIGNALTMNWAPLSVSDVERVLDRHMMIAPSFAQLVCEILPVLQFKEFLRPAQVDACGNTNNIAIGDYSHPRVRLPGSGGIPDVSSFSTNTYLYNPRHGRASFVEKLDFISGVGVGAKTGGVTGSTSPGPRAMVTDLGLFDFCDGRMRLLSYHPGTTIERIQARTGFSISLAPGVGETPAPSSEELRLLREVIDPLGVRKLETLSGQERWSLLRHIARHEQNEQTVNQQAPASQAGDSQKQEAGRGRP